MKKLTIPLLSFFLIVLTITAGDKINYPAPFNPVKGLINQVESTHRQEICLNGTWDFMPIQNAKAEDFKLPSRFNWETIPIKIPSPWNVNNFTDGQGGDFVAYPSYPKEWEKAKIGWMRKKANIPANWSGKQLKLHFESVMGKAMVYVNGTLVAENFELFLPFEADVTNHLKPGQENEILVGVAKADLFDDRGKYGRRTYVGGSMWGIEMAGIWQDVYLFAFSKVHVDDIFIKPDVTNGKLNIELDLVNHTDKKVSLTINGEIRKWYNRAGLTINEVPEQKGELAKSPSFIFPALKKVTIEPNSTQKITLTTTVTNQLEYWTPETPELYGAVIQLAEGKETIDTKYERFGWREFKIAGDKLLLNGKPINLKGDSWHFTGVPQMTRRYAWAWFTMLKDVNANAVRFHAQPFPRFYMDLADEMGICVLSETGIWSSDGGPKIDSEAYWESCVEHIKRLIKRDKNHASIFGWSVCNETVPVAVHVFKAPEELVQRQLEEINRWVRVTQEADPTRTWISGDGETDRPTILPTIIGHYGGTEGMQKWASQGKPWGIGEQSMAYYGTPKQASKYNGNRAYESMLGRMEAIAIESYDLIKLQRELNASYSCVFNLAWYALQPLPLGMKDTTRDPQASDGIFFGFTEGGYGMQPERLGPYTTTLNPGYDNTLPLYRKWPLLDAVRCANATPILPNPVFTAPEIRGIYPVTLASEVVLFAGESSTLKTELEELGIRVNISEKPAANALIIIDGANLPANVKQLSAIRKAIESGTKTLIMGITPQSLEVINSFLSWPVALEEREATSFLVSPSASELQGLSHADFYFSELIPRGKTAMNYGLSGDFSLKAEVLLRACNTDWQRWNYRPETSKTGNVFRSEQEAKGSDIVIAKLKTGKSDVIISTLDLKEIRQETRGVMSKLLQNLGAEVSNANLSSMQALNSNAQLHRSMMSNNGNPDSWNMATANDKEVFEFHSAHQEVWLSYWVYSPRSLSNLLAEPDMPNMDMFITAKTGVTVWLNGTEIYSSNEMKDAMKETKVPNVMLDKGWNEFKIKLQRREGNEGIKASVHYDSADKAFMKQVLSSVAR